MRLWKTLLTVLTATLLAGLLIACGSAAPTPTQAAGEAAAVVPTPTQAGAAVEAIVIAPVAPAETAPVTSTAPKQKPVLGGIWDRDGVPVGTDPYNLAAPFPDPNFYDSLVKVRYPWDPAKGVQFDPQLATEWTQNGAKWTIKLRQGVTWHDGEAFNADDVVATIKRIIDPDFLIPAAAVPIKKLYVGARKVDNYTVELDTGTPNSTTFAFLSAFFHPMTPEHLITGSDPASTDVTKRWKIIGKTATGFSPTGTIAVGTGPFKMTEHKPESHIFSIKNPNFYKFDEDGTRLPYLGGIHYHHILDPSRRVANFVAGNLEYSQGLASGMTLRHASALCKQSAGKDPGCYLNRWPHGYGTLLFNEVSSPAFKDPKVMAATRYGHDVDTVMLNAYAGGDSYMWVARSRYPDSALSQKEQFEVMPWSNPARKAEFLQKGRDLLTEAGYPKGVDLPFPFFAAGASANPLCTGSFLDHYSRHAEELNKSGLNTFMECRQGVVYGDELKAGKWSVAGFYPSITLLTPAGGLIQGALIESFIVGAPWPWNGRAAADARYRVIQQTADETKRNELFKEAERFLADTTLTQWPTFYTTVYMSVHSCVHNYLPGGTWNSQLFAMERAWLDGECAKPSLT